MRITVTIRTFVEGNSCVSRLPARRRWCVAFRARHLRMQPRERVPGLRMVKLGRRFPVHEIVTLQAVLPQLAVVNVFVATDAILRLSEERAAQIFHFDKRARIRLNTRRHVALAAVNPSMFSLKDIARLRVIEAFEGRYPVDQGEIFAVVFGVALRAVCFVCKARMQSAILGQLLRDFSVALLALQHGCPGSDFVAA
jgi:hypothetical protein